MTEYAFFLQKVDHWRKDMALMWGDINICPSLHWFQIPSLSQVEMSSLNGLKALRERQKSCYDITFLLVLTREEATGDRKYGLLTVWVNPSQARVPSMEEAVGKLTTWISSGPNWPYTLVQLHKGTHHAPLPKEGHLGILPQRGAEATPCRWISQLDVCQLLIAGAQVAYPIGLNRCKEPIITSLLEPLAYGVSLTAGKPVYLEINILSSPAGEPDWKVPPIGEVSTTVIASPHKFIPPKIGKRGQHDPGGKESPISSDAGHTWLWVWKFNSKGAKPSGHPYASTSQAKGTTSASRYFISGKCRDGRSISRGNPHQYLSHCCDL